MERTDQSLDRRDGLRSLALNRVCSFPAYNRSSIAKRCQKTNMSLPKVKKSQKISFLEVQSGKKSGMRAYEMPENSFAASAVHEGMFLIK
ncbi:hypothetical protein N665_0304s0003 [Sinapis alba]|nr:hypothetical protein N665_0304s0003 [Sinapis alba]